MSTAAVATADGAAHRLLGPPEIRLHSPAPAAAPSPAPAADSTLPTGEPFLDLMDVGFNASNPPMGRTENNSATFLSSGDPCLNFFFQIVPDTPADTVASLLSSAWSHDPLTALKLVCHLRAVRGTGKSDRQGFYAAALWLHKHHPRTLALNASPISTFGYLKDLPELLHRLVAGSDTRQRMGRGKRPEPVGVKVAPAEARRQRRIGMAARSVERYASDPEYRFLHDRTSDLFASLLSADLARLASGELRSITLAAKWCPSLDSSYDRSTLLCESISRRVFPRDSDPKYSSIEDEHYAYRVRDRLRREALVPLRRALELPEIYMTAGDWASLPYSRVPSVAMKNYKKLFLKHDEKRFNEFLEQVKEGKAKIAAGALLPHEILAPAMQGVDDEVAELQWQRMVRDLSEKGKLQNCIAVCDVSGSMSGVPMDVCIALGLLISELSDDPWRGRVITFSENPQLHWIKGDSIKEKISFIREMDWGSNTNFQAVFDQILKIAVEGKLEAEKMIKRIFVFSDMEFDEASANSWETDYQAICRKFQESGYGSVVPEIVFWNLRDSQSIPVLGDQKGVALVSGFSKNMLTLFLDGNGIINPKDVLEQAIAGKEYQSLAVYD